MDDDIQCGCAEKHKEHICVLRGKGLVCRVKCLTDKPNVICETCNHQANCEENVCKPLPLFV